MPQVWTWKCNSSLAKDVKYRWTVPNILLMEEFTEGSSVFVFSFLLFQFCSSSLESLTSVQDLFVVFNDSINILSVPISWKKSWREMCLWSRNTASCHTAAFILLRLLRLASPNYIEKLLSIPFSACGAWCILIMTKLKFYLLHYQ